jgi:hypothetical protein
VSVAVPSVLDDPSGFASRYRRLVLIATHSQLDAIRLDGETLVIGSDWLAWREAAARGWAALHIEAGLADCRDARTWRDAYLDAARWPLIDGQDATLFQGVSIGHQFIREIGHAGHYYERFRHAITALARRFKVETIELVDLRSDYDLLDAQAKRWLVAEAAEAAGVGVIDRLDRAPAEADQFSTARMVVNPPSETDVLRAAWETVMDAVSRLARIARGPRKTLLILPSLLMLEPMVRSFSHGRRLAPVLLSDRYPKRFAFALQALRRGFFLAAFPRAPLTQDENAAVDSIVARLRAAWADSTQAPARGAERFRRAYVLDTIVASGRFAAMAARIRNWRRLFERHRFRRVLVTDSTNYESRIPVELARTFGIPADELVNGMFNTHQRHDTRVGLDGRAPLLARFLSWGTQGEEWLAETGSPLPARRTGCPALDSLRAAPTARARWTRALVLACPPGPDDLVALRGDGFKYAVDVLAMLAEEGYETRFKLHPGLERTVYYAEVFRRHGIETTILKSEPIHPEMAWADVVIGPITSGAMVESMTMGKPYIPVVMPPSGVTEGGKVDLPVCRNADEVRDRLRRPGDLVAMIAGARERLSAFASISDAGAEVWRALTEPEGATA